jgi:hypothetical protein
MSVIDINKYRKHQNLSIEISRDRQPLDTSHSSSSLNERILRIKESLNRIDVLFAELKKMDENRTKDF